MLDRIVAVQMEKEGIGFQEVQAIFAECGCKMPTLQPVSTLEAASVG